MRNVVTGRPLTTDAEVGWIQFGRYNVIVQSVDMKASHERGAPEISMAIHLRAYPIKK